MVDCAKDGFNQRNGIVLKRIAVDTRNMVDYLDRLRYIGDQDEFDLLSQISEHVSTLYGELCRLKDDYVENIAFLECENETRLVEVVMPETKLVEVVMPETKLVEVVLPKVVLPKVVLPETKLVEVVLPKVVMPETKLVEDVLPKVVLPKAVLPETKVPYAEIDDTATVINKPFVHINKDSNEFPMDDEDIREIDYTTGEYNSLYHKSNRKGIVFNKVDANPTDCRHEYGCNKGGDCQGFHSENKQLTVREALSDADHVNVGIKLLKYDKFVNRERFIPYKYGFYSNELISINKICIPTLAEYNSNTDMAKFQLLRTWYFGSNNQRDRVLDFIKTNL